MDSNLAGSISVTVLVTSNISWSENSDPAQITVSTRSTTPASISCEMDRSSSYIFEVNWESPKLESGFYGFVVKKNQELFKIVTKDEPKSLKFSKDIHPGNTYKIEISTTFGNKTSNPVSCLVTTKPLPVIELSCQKFNDSVVTVSWSVSKESAQDNFIVTLKQKIGKFIEVVRTKSTSITFYDLSPELE